MLGARVIVALSLALAASTRASPFTSDAYTPIDGATPLDASHPANDIAPFEDLIAPERASSGTAVDLERLRWFADTYLDGAEIEVNFDKLQDAPYRQGRAETLPWSGNDWGRDEDGINKRWAGTNTTSPAEKYATAFGLDPVAFTDAISASTGVDSLAQVSKACTDESVCDDFGGIQGYCVRRAGAESGYCSHRGSLNHAFTLASIVEPEPDCPVEVDDKTVFEPMDIEALLSQLYHEAELDVVFFGSRTTTIRDLVDQYGRYSDEAERDVNPALLHLALANVLGAQSMPFVIDTNPYNWLYSDSTQSFNVTKMDLIDVAEGAKTYFGVTEYPFNKDAAYLVDVTATIVISKSVYETPGGTVASGNVTSSPYSSEEELTYLLELDANKNVIGGEWTKHSMTSHPDFFWIPSPDAAISEDFETEYGLRYADVKELLTKSVGPCK